MKEGYPERLLEGMVRIYSPSGSEGEISTFLSKELRQLGFDVKIDNVGNVEGRFGSGSPRILLCGHMDTVEGELEVKRRGKVLFGRGAVDAKSPLAALICGAARHLEKGGKGTIVVLGVVDEEGRSRGMKHFLERSDEKFDYAVFGEPSGAYAVTVGYKGRLLLRVRCKTESGHASAPQLFENAIYVCMRVIGALQTLSQEWAGDGEKDLFDIPTLCVTSIKGGMQENTVPPICEIAVDMRIPPGWSLKQVKERVSIMLEECRVSEKRAKIEEGWGEENQPFLENPDSKLVRSFLDAIRGVRGREGRLSRKTGTGDVNDFVKKYDTSAVVYGPGNSKLDHTSMENVSMEEYNDSIKVIENVLWKLSNSS